MRPATANKVEFDRRSSLRGPCFLDAFALPGPQFCTVVDRSGTGLRLRFRRSYDNRADLLIVLLESGQAFATSAKWSKDGEVGVVISAECNLEGLVPSTFAEARQIWKNLTGSGRNQ